MATIDKTYKLEICTDCYMYAHGVLEEGPEDFEVPHIARSQAFEQFGQYLIETDHSEYCESDADDQCGCCHEASFSWYACHVCGVQLGGDRHSVVILTLAS